MNFKTLSYEAKNGVDLRQCKYVDELKDVA